MPPLVIAIDLGTTGCRAAAYREDGAQLASHYLEYGLTHPEPGAAEQEPEGWWSAARQCTKRVVATLPEPRDVVALAISAQGHSWVPTNAELRPLRPALTWLDTRATEIARGLLIGKGSLYWGQRVGKVPGPWHTLPQILWLRAAEPGVDQEAAHYLFAHDFLVARLCGKPATDYTTAAGSLLFNLHEFSWDEALAAEHQIDITRFSPLFPAGAVVGGLQAEAAADMGLQPGTLVAAGAQDQKCAALAAGLDESAATVSLGTATAITAFARRPVYDEAAAIPCFPYLWKGAWVLEAPVVTSGGAFRWLRNLARGFGAERATFEDLSTLAASAPAGSHGVRFFPFLAGSGAPHWMSEARGCFSGLALDTTAADLARAVLEGVACEVRTNLDAMQRQGVEIRRLRLFGGGARSDLWATIIAAVTELPVERSTDVERAVAGAAILAMKAAGLLPTLSDGQKRLRGPRDWFEPEPNMHYGDIYEDYCIQREALWRMVRKRGG